MKIDRQVVVRKMKSWHNFVLKFGWIVEEL